jgi:hypothetical protein
VGREAIQRGLIAAAAAVALAMPSAAAAQDLGGFRSDNVTWLSHDEATLGTAEGGRLVGKTFFMTNNQQGLFSFDVSDPEHPKQLGTLLLPHGAENEDVATNGRILLLSQLGDVYHLADGQVAQGHWLNVIDVRDPSNMKVIAKVDGAGDHTWDCVLDCTWAYSTTGHILDLRDPAKPKLLEKRWRDILDAGVSPGFVHDLNEVSPGMVMASSSPMFLMDATDPANPKVTATAPEDSSHAQHNAVWPRHAADRFMVTASEGSNLGRCEAYGDDASLQVWDTTGWERTRTWEMMGFYTPVNGTFTDGNPAVDATWYGCSAHWAETHPNFHDGGPVAGAFYSHGIKILSVGADGNPVEAGFFLRHGAGASAVYWITDRVLYAVDDTFGLDVIRWDGPIPTPPAAPPAARPSGPGAVLVDRVAPTLKVVGKPKLRKGRLTLRLRCPQEDCFGTVSARGGARRFSIAAGRTAAVTVRLRGRTPKRLRVKITATDRAGNRVVATTTARR